jgi:hypothetical protein
VPWLPSATRPPDRAPAPAPTIRWTCRLAIPSEVQVWKWQTHVLRSGSARMWIDRRSRNRDLLRTSRFREPCQIFDRCPASGAFLLAHSSVPKKAAWPNEYSISVDQEPVGLTGSTTGDVDIRRFVFCNHKHSAHPPREILGKGSQSPPSGIGRIGKRNVLLSEAASGSPATSASGKTIGKNRAQRKPPSVLALPFKVYSCEAKPERPT